MEKQLDTYFGKEYMENIREIAALRKVVIGGKSYRVSTHGSLLLVERGRFELHTYGPNSLHTRFVKRDGEWYVLQHVNGGALGGQGGETRYHKLLKWEPTKRVRRIHQ